MQPEAIAATIDPLDAFATFLRKLGFKVRNRSDALDALVYRVGQYHEYARQDADGTIFLTGAALEHWQHFLAVSSLPAIPVVVQRHTATHPSSYRNALLARDGWVCCLCGQEMPSYDITLEHWLALGRGGNNELANLALAHERCNHIAADLGETARARIPASPSCGARLDRRRHTHQVRGVGRRRRVCPARGDQCGPSEVRSTSWRTAAGRDAGEWRRTTSSSWPGRSGLARELQASRCACQITCASSARPTCSRPWSSAPGR